MTHTAETKLAVKVHQGGKGFTVRMNFSDGRKSDAAISFPSLHKIHHGMVDIRAGRKLVHEDRSEYGTVTVKEEIGLFHIVAKPFNPKTPEVDALVSLKVVEIMVGLANDCIHGKLNPHETYDIHPQMVSESEPATAAVA